MKEQRIYELYKNEKFGEDVIENIRDRIKKEKTEKRLADINEINDDSDKDKVKMISLNIEEN